MTLDARAHRAATEFRHAAEDWGRSTPERQEFERFDRARHTRQRNARLRVIAVACAIAVIAIFVASRAVPDVDRTAAPPPARNGRLVFVRFDPESDEPVAFSIDPDGTNSAQMFFSGFFSGHSEWPHWSPDGTEVAVFCCGDGAAAHLVDPETGTVRELSAEDPDRLEQHCGFAWTPDERLLACGNFGLTDPGETGIWLIRSSDGGGGRQLTSNPGREDDPGDFSPDGERLVFLRMDERERPEGLFVIGVDGSGLHRITPEGMLLEPFGGSWSPSGDRILFVARTDRRHRPAIWEVNADGSGMHQVAISPACGGPISDPRSIGCSYPGWSPDGTKFVFTLITGNGVESDIAIADADGSGVVLVTRTGDADQADWGTHPTIANG